MDGRNTLWFAASCLQVIIPIQCLTAMAQGSMDMDEDACARDDLLGPLPDTSSGHSVVLSHATSLMAPLQRSSLSRTSSKSSAHSRGASYHSLSPVLSSVRLEAELGAPPSRPLAHRSPGTFHIHQRTPIPVLRAPCIPMPGPVSDDARCGWWEDCKCCVRWFCRWHMIGTLADA